MIALHLTKGDYPNMANILRVSIVKSKGHIDLDLEKDVPDDVYKEALALGLKVLLNRGTSKITKTTYPKAEELVAAAQEAAEKQLELIRTSKIKFTGSKAKVKGGGAVMTEALRLAKALVKDSMKAEGLKISHYKASEITVAAKAVLEGEQGQAILAKAEANIAERAAVPIGIDLGKIMTADPELVKKAEAKKSEKKPLSAKQAGKVQKRKPTAQPTA